MAERKTKQELEEIKKKYNVDDIYSWSRYNLSKTDMYSYYLRYIKRVKEDRSDSIYSYAGSLVHDLMEGFYNGEFKKDELVNIYEEKMFEFELAGYKFNRSDEDKNTATANKYNYCNKHYLKNFIPIVGENIKLEDYVLVRVGKFLFNGYSDFEYEKDNKKHIVDFKTSTIYKGEKAKKESGQLLLYALSKVQEGWDIDNIVAGWLFTKYVSVDVPKKGGFTTRYIERNEIGSKLKASVVAQLKKVRMYDDDFIQKVLSTLKTEKQLIDLPVEIEVELGEIQAKKDGEIKVAYVNKLKKLLEKYPKYNQLEIESFVEEMIIMNNLDSIPKEVSVLYRIYDCFIEIEITEEAIENLKSEIINQIVKIHRLTNDYNNDSDLQNRDKRFYQEIDKSNEFFFNILSGYSSKLHKPYKEYLDSINLDKDDEDIEEDISDLLLELGIDI